MGEIEKMKTVLFLANKDNVLYNFRKEVVLAVKKAGYKVVLCCPYGSKIDYFIKENCEFVDIKIDRRGTNIFKDFKLLGEYKSIIDKVRPDIVLTYTSKPSIYGGYICGKKKIPYIVNNAGLMETKGALAIILKLLYFIGWSKASCMMYQNEREKEVVNKILKNKIPYCMIPGSGVNLTEFVYKPYPENNNKIIFNYVARIVKIKGIEEYLECANIIKKKYPNTEFRIFGEFDDEFYKEKIMSLEKKGVIKYCGIQFDMKPYIEAAHAVIHPSYYEGMTNVVLEHSAVGRPCIGSDIAGVREGIDDNKTGFLFKLKDVDSMVDAVERFIKLSYSEKVLMGKNARKKMESTFNRNIVIDIYIDEIKRILGDM